MAKDRWYLAYDDEKDELIIIGWNLSHEPNKHNECGYTISGGPYDTKQEAEDAL